MYKLTLKDANSKVYSVSDTSVKAVIIRMIYFITRKYQVEV
jgi:hypothetical protein